MIPNDNIQADATAKPFRVLSLDGGGAKGVYTLGVLKEVEAIANAPLCEVFDLIFGTSTGSIIAALIALGYRIEEIESLYFALVPKIMAPRFSGARTRALKREAEHILGKCTCSPRPDKGYFATDPDWKRVIIEVLRIWSITKIEREIKMFLS